MPIVSKLKKNIRSGFSNKDYINSGDTPVFIAVLHEPWQQISQPFGKAILQMLAVHKSLT